MFWVIKTQHEGRDRDVPKEVEERFFEIGKNTLKTCSVFLANNVQHAVDEWWISWWGGKGCGAGFVVGRTEGEEE